MRPSYWLINYVDGVSPTSSLLIKFPFFLFIIISRICFEFCHLDNKLHLGKSCSIYVRLFVCLFVFVPCLEHHVSGRCSNPVPGFMTQTRKLARKFWFFFSTAKKFRNLNLLATKPITSSIRMLRPERTFQI